MGMRCPGTGSPFPRWALRWVVMTNAVTLLVKTVFQRRKPKLFAETGVIRIVCKKTFSAPAGEQGALKKSRHVNTIGIGLNAIREGIET